jgi:glycerol-3-phosphate O-acyltransferase
VTWLGLDRSSLWLFRKLLFLWARTKVLPDDLDSLEIDRNKPVCYGLESRSLSNLLVLEQACIDGRLPSPSAQLTLPHLKKRRAVFSLSRVDGRGLFGARSRRAPPQLERLVAALRQHPELDVQIVPVSVFWGRSPDREDSWLRLLFADNWAVVGRLRKFVMIALHARNIFVQFNRPISLRPIVNEGLDPARTVRKLYRALRIYFRRQRVAAVGPDLSHRRTLVNRLLDTRGVRTAIHNEAKEKGISRDKATSIARKYAKEIAADYSYPVIRLLDRALRRLWDSLYDGVSVNHIKTLNDAVPGNEVIYVPCHRSHIDYLLLSYVLYRKGFVPPHIAAGINLNLPLVGPILRRGGAFFLRRSFRGNPLYSAVFFEYLCANIAKGISIEYFIEGGRSRTGRLLRPSPGMLAMTVRGSLRDPAKPVVFVPIYIGYEKLVEGQSFVSELSGKPKKKESIGAFVRALWALRSDFGQVHLNFGEPIPLQPELDQRLPDWRDDAESHEHRPPWLPSIVDHLSGAILRRINEAADVNPINLLGLALLSTPKQAMDERELAQQLELYGSLLRAAPYAERVSVTALTGSEMIAYGEKLGFLERRPHALGDIIVSEGRQAVLLTYFRNNILHLVTLPSLVACCFISNRVLPLEKIIYLGNLVYPYLKSELFLRWQEAETSEAIRATVTALIEHGLLRPSPEDEVIMRPAQNTLEAVQLGVLAHAILPTLERFYITLALLRKSDPKQINQAALEESCHLMAQRMSLLHEFNSPEFFDRSLFSNFIATLREQDVLCGDDNQALTLNASLDAINEDAKLMLSEQLRHSILQLTR